MGADASHPLAMRRRWPRIVGRVLAVVALLLGVAVLLLLLVPFGQRVDPAYRPEIAAPRYRVEHPQICFDEGHYNAHTAGGRYAPLARLLEADGYAVRRHRGRFTDESLRACRVLVVANAAGGDRPKIGPINLPIQRSGERNAAAFTAEEVGRVRDWVARGGSLLLVADHAPFGEASRALAAAFGVGMGGGFVELPRNSPANGGPGQAQFTAAKGLLRPHPITQGLRRVLTFTGQSLSGAGEKLLLLPDDAVEFVPPGPELRPVSAANRSQAVALVHGEGRVAVLGEAGMISAQLDANGSPIGMNVAGADNELFARNLFHWLSRGR